MSDPIDPLPAVSILVKSELQYDYQAQVSPFEGSSLSAMSLTVSRDKERYLNVYYIQGGAIYNAYQTYEHLPTGSPPWSVESMRFDPEFTGATPVLVRALGLVGPGHADWVTAVSNKNDIYLLDTSEKYSYWRKLPLLDQETGSNPMILDVSLFLASDTMPYISVVTNDNRMFLLDSFSLDREQWFEDISVRDWYMSGVLAFASSGVFAWQFNATSFGYLIAGANGTPGLTILTGVPDSRGITFKVLHPFEQYHVVVDSATSYNSVQIASMPAFTAPSYPLIFAIDNAFNAHYFQVQDDRCTKFLKVPIFSGIKVRELTACFRADGDATSNIVNIWIEVFALGFSGNTYHMESLADKLVQLKNGHYAVQAWGDYSPLSSDAVSIAGVVSYDGMAYMAEYQQSMSTMNVHTQDPTTTDWKVNAVALPAPLRVPEEPQVTKQHVYYIVATIIDGNGLPVPGHAVVVSSSQHAVININGHVKSIDSVHTANTLTNGVGQLSFSLATDGSLSIPIFSLWAEGMELNHVVDVKPNGPIQSRLHNMTLEEARQARNYDVPDHPLLFPDNEYSDDDVRQALAAMKHSLSITDPSFSSECNSTIGVVRHDFPIRKYLHPQTHSAVARTRLCTAPSLAYSSGRADLGVEITFYPKLHVRTFKAGEGLSDNDLNLSWKSFKSAFGDFWNGVKKGFHKVVSVVIDAVKDGVDATIKFIKDGVQYVWKEVVNLVQMGFHLVDLIFNTLKKAFKVVFGWLAQLFDMDSINRSANRFKTTLLTFPQFAQTFFGTTLPNATLGSGSKAKAWLTKVFDDAEGVLAKKTVGEYSDPALLPSVGFNMAHQETLLTGAGSVLDSLPSTALWLINKIFSASSSGSAGEFGFEKSLNSFNDLWDKFWTQLESVDLQGDLKQIVSDLYKTFKDFKLRNVFNGTLWVDLLKVVKDVVFLIIDISEGLALAVEYLIAETIDFFVEMLNMPLEIPVISSIFKVFTGHDLTIINVVSYLVAVPFSFLYQLITGSKPFEDSLLSGLDPSKSLNIAKGTVMIVRTCYLTAVSAIQDEGDVWLTGNWWGRKNDIFSPFMARILNGISYSIPIICFGLAGYPSLEKPSLASIVAWGAELIPAGLILFHVVRTRSANTLSPNSRRTDWVIFGVGALKLGIAIYQTLTLEPSNAHDALVASYWFKPWSSFAQPLRSLAVDMDDPIDAQYVIGAKAVVNGVCGLGEAIAFIVANSKA